MKKSHFFDFFFSIDNDQLSLIANFSNFWQKISKLSCSMLCKGHQRRASYLKLCRNGGPLPTGWAWGEHLLELKDWREGGLNQLKGLLNTCRAIWDGLMAVKLTRKYHFWCLKQVKNKIVKHFLNNVSLQWFLLLVLSTSLAFSFDKG